MINYNELVLSKKTEEEVQESEHEIILMEKFDFSENRMTINLENITGIEEINKSINWDFDALKLRFPLRLRRPKEGDEFYPLGFSGKKKVSKFFRDEKLSILARQKIWLLTDGENSVLGVVPFRQDRRYSRDENTEAVLKIFNKK
uniref:tRNA lysidine(34) synthetase TilS n=2 Tax=Chryseobacterium TaxID=59732 RepID=A0AAU6WRH1_9FLAO